MGRSGDNMLRRLRFMASPQFLDAASRGVFEAADAVKAEAQHLITAGSISGRGHVPSKPGEPPNNEFGDLKSGIEVSQPSPFVGRVTSTAAHARPLEFGTSKMAARPHIRPARDNTQPEAERILEQQIRKARRKFNRGK